MGSEYRVWILYCALCVINGVLSPVYFNHLYLLVSALHILTSDYIQREKLAEAERALKQFYLKFSELYGNELCIHGLACMYMYSESLILATRVL